jgi:hypothetical protein
MADERLLAPIRRFWSRSEVEAAYSAIFSAFHSRVESVTVIISKSSEGDSASGQLVIANEDYLRWMDALETRLQELEAADEGVTSTLEGTAHVNFGNRYAST